MKLQGTGNDFVLVRESDLRSRGDLPALARRLCDRHFGIGADGLLIIGSSTSADYRMEIWNPDGSEAETCGNALRCVGRWKVALDGWRNQEFLVETGMGVVPVRATHAKTGGPRFETEMGTPELERSKIPMIGPSGRVLEELLVVDGQSFVITALGMGNPHCVVFLPEIANLDLQTLGPKFERHPAFPNRTNTEFVAVTGHGSLRQRTFERGAGETLSCGSGAAASAVAAKLTGRAGSEVQVELQGGVLEVNWASEMSPVLVRGNAEVVFEGEWRN